MQDAKPKEKDGITEEAKVRAENIAQTMFDQADKKAGIKRPPRIPQTPKPLHNE